MVLTRTSNVSFKNEKRDIGYRTTYCVLPLYRPPPIASLIALRITYRFAHRPCICTHMHLHAFYRTSHTTYMHPSTHIFASTARPDIYTRYEICAHSLYTTRSNHAHPAHDPRYIALFLLPPCNPTSYLHSTSHDYPAARYNMTPIHLLNMISK